MIVLHSTGRPGAVAAMASKGWHCIARPGLNDKPGEILAWCEDESDEGLSQVERATAASKLDCAAVELVDVLITFADTNAASVVCKAWVPTTP